MTPLQAVRAIAWRKHRGEGHIDSYSKPLSDDYRLLVYPSGMWSVRGRATYEAPYTLHGQPVPIIAGPPVVDLASGMEGNVTLAKAAVERWAAGNLASHVPFP